MKNKLFWVYILRVRNGNYYTGYTNNIIRRYREHLAGTASRYTRSFRPVKLKQCWQVLEDQGKAMKIESLIKKKHRKIKEKIVNNPKELKKIVFKSTGLDLNIRIYNPTRVINAVSKGKRPLKTAAFHAGIHKILFILLLYISTGFSRPYPHWMEYKPIRLTPEREILTRDYTRIHYGEERLFMDPQMIVIHSTSIKGFQQSWNYFNNERIEPKRSFIGKYGKLNICPHYMVDRAGKIYQLMPDNMIARHVIGLNYFAIGIENTGGRKLSEAQLVSNARLIRYLAEKYPDIKYIIGHYEYRKFEGTPVFIERYKEYRTYKNDPDRRSMKRLRKELKFLGPDRRQNYYY